MRTFAIKILAVLLLVWHIPAFTASAVASEEGGSVAKFEIKKFRFSRNKKRNFERLVIEFTPKGVVGSGGPGVKVLPQNGGKEANVQVEPAMLVGAIPEAMINDSYVTRSEFLGPISISTDGPNPGFFLRTFLKEAVNVEAFWLKRPYRLVLDVFPANSPRVEGPEFDREGRGIASVDGPAPTSRKGRRSGARDGIVCYPVSAQVSAALAFHPRGIDAVDVKALESERSSPDSGSTEQVVCYLTSSQVEPSVTYKSKSKDYPTYYQDGSKSPMGAATGMPGAGGPRGPASVPGVPGAPAAKPGSLVPDVAPGTTPLGSSLPNPENVKVTTSMAPPKLATMGGAPGGAPIGSLPPAPAAGLPGVPGAPRPNTAGVSLLPGIK